MSSGDLIARRRRERGLTQEQLAEEIFTSRQTIAMWETSKQFPGDEVALFAARFLELNEEELLERLRWDRLHRRIDELETRHNAVITIRPNQEDATATYSRENATQTLQGVTLTVTSICKSIQFPEDKDRGSSYGVRAGADRILFHHRGEALIVYLLCTNTNPAFNPTEGEFYLLDDQGNQFHGGATGATNGGGVTRQIGVLFPRYDPRATSFTLRYDVVNSNEAECDVLSFENVPIDGEGITRSLNGDTLTYHGVHGRKQNDRLAIRLTHDRPITVRHVGVPEVIDDLGNRCRYGLGRHARECEETPTLSHLDPKAKTLNFKYLLARTLLAFELRNLPMPA